MKLTPDIDLRETLGNNPLQRTFEKKTFNQLKEWVEYKNTKEASERNFLAATNITFDLGDDKKNYTSDTFKSVKAFISCQFHRQKPAATNDRLAFKTNFPFENVTLYASQIENCVGVIFSNVIFDETDEVAKNYVIHNIPSAKINTITNITSCDFRNCHFQGTYINNQKGSGNQYFYDCSLDAIFISNINTSIWKSSLFGGNIRSSEITRMEECNVDQIFFSCCEINCANKTIFSRCDFSDVDFVYAYKPLFENCSFCGSYNSHFEKQAKPIFNNFNFENCLFYDFAFSNAKFANGVFKFTGNDSSVSFSGCTFENVTLVLEKVSIDDFLKKNDFFGCKGTIHFEENKIIVMDEEGGDVFVKELPVHENACFDDEEENR